MPAQNGSALKTTLTMTNTNQFMLTRRHLAERWSVSRETLKRRERAGLLPFLKLGRDVRYRLDDIERIEKEARVSR
jgi:predicted site-specific integrase-resolvase